MLRLLLTLGKEQGKSFVLSTHLLGDVERVCETVVILDGGRVLRHGDVDELRPTSGPVPPARPRQRSGVH